MKDKRPVNLNLLSIKQPHTAIASILHRGTGVILYIAIPFVLCCLASSLASQESYNGMLECFSSPVARVITWVILSAFLYHFIAGMRHLVMDFGFWEEKCSGTLSARLTILLSVIGAVALGVWLW